VIRIVTSALALALVAAACGSTAPTPSASSAVAAAPTASVARLAATVPPTPLPAWQDAQIVHPVAVNGFASQPPGYFCDPCHNLSQDDLFGIGRAAGGFIAVGDVTPPASAIGLWSPDGASWAPLQGFTSTNGSAAVAVTELGDRIVIVGHDPTGAAAWSFDGHSWTPAPAQASLQVPYAAGGMTSVVPFDGGFVAAGYRDNPAAARALAAVWRSADGLRWTLDAQPASNPMAGARILGLVANGDTLVAVGTAGDLIKGPAAAWRWTKASGWTKVPVEGGAMEAVVATPDGFVAVGVNPSDDGAMAWTSSDGGAWQAVPDQPAFHFYELAVRLQALTLAGGTLVAGGWRSDPGKGSSVTVTSTDGRTWAAQPWQASFSGGQIDALAAGNGTLVAAGRVGYPDNTRAAVWLRSWP
jgi:hypothetical protein